MVGARRGATLGRRRRPTRQPNGEWNATRTSDLPPGASLCAWLLNVSEASGLAAAAASPLAEAVHASEVANLAAALQAKPPWTALGTAQLRAGALGAGTPTSPSRPAPRQYITLTEPLKGERGAVVWDPAPMLAAHAACYERLSVRLVVYAGGGDGGDGLSVALGHFTSGELLHVLGSANGTIGAREPLVLRLRRASRGVGEGSIELWLRGERRWRASGAAAALPAGRWVAIHLVFAGAADAIHLMIDGVERLRNFPLDGGGPFEAPADGGGGGWRFGVAASSAAFVDRHAVAEARCSCGDGASVDLPFTTTTDGWNHVPAPPPPTAPPGAPPPPQAPQHRPWRYYAEPTLSQLTPSLGHTVGGSLVRLRGALLHLGVARDYWCAYGPHGQYAYWTRATWAAATADVACRSPPVATEHTATVRVSLNGQQLSLAGSPYAYYAARITSFGPTSGPVKGGTMLNVFGRSLQLPPAAPQARCVFDEAQQTAATWVGEGSGKLRCASPPFASTDSALVRFSVSLNGQDLTDDEPPFHFFYIAFGGALAAPPSPASPPPDPPSPPVDGLGRPRRRRRRPFRPRSRSRASPCGTSTASPGRSPAARRSSSPSTRCRSSRPPRRRASSAPASRCPRCWSRRRR